jgi:hypothetical protein
VEVERKQARKAGNNARGVVGLACILSAPLYIKTHWGSLEKLKISPRTRFCWDEMTVCFYINKHAAGYVSGRLPGS